VIEFLYLCSHNPDNPWNCNTPGVWLSFMHLQCITWAQSFYYHMCIILCFNVATWCFISACKCVYHMWCLCVLLSTLEGLYMSHVPCFKCCMALFQCFNWLFRLFHLNVSYVANECFSGFDKLEYMCDMQMNVVTHQNTLATLRMSLGTMFMKVISPNYASRC
jgi:hypothetical protein